MHRIDTKTAQKDKFGAGKNGFTRGNPQTGTPATDLDDDYFDMLQEELCSVVEASGASLEKGRHDQLLTALRALLLSRKNPFGDIKSDGTVQTALENLGLGAAAKQGVATSTQMQAGTATDLLPSVAAVMSLFSKRSFATNDFIRIPNVPGGLIIQWGEATTSPSSYFVNFPMMFPTSCFGVVLSDRAATSTVGSTGRTQSGFQLVSSYAGTTLSFFIAIGR